MVICDWSVIFDVTVIIALAFFYQSSESRSVMSDSFRLHGIVYGILQTRILEWVTVPFSRGSSQPRDRTQVSRIAGGFFISWATREAQEYWGG